MITFECGHCGNSIRVPEQAAGRKGKCNKCGESLTVPSAAPPAEVGYSLTGLDEEPEEELEEYAPPATVRPRKPKRAAPPVAVQVNVTQPSRAAHSLGIASLVLGILAFLICWIPLIGALGLPLSGLGFVLGVIGLILAMVRSGHGVGFPIAGSAICGLAFFIALSMTAAILQVPDAIAQARAAAERAKNKPAVPLKPPGAPMVPAGGAPAAAAPAVEEKPLTYRIGQPFENETVVLTLTSAKVEKPELKNFSGDKFRLKEDSLLVTFRIRNKQPRKVLNFYSGDIGGDRIEAKDDVENSITNGPTRDLVGALRFGEDIPPETEVEHVDRFDVPLPKTEHVTLSFDMRIFQQSGIVTFQIDAGEIKGFRRK